MEAERIANGLEPLESEEEEEESSEEDSDEEDEDEMKPDIPGGDRSKRQSKAPKKKRDQVWILAQSSLQMRFEMFEINGNNMEFYKDNNVE